MSMIMLVQVARASQQPMKTLKQWRKMILDNRWITIRQIPDDVGISFVSCQAILTGVLGMKRADSKIVSKLLNFDQNQRHKDIA